MIGYIVYGRLKSKRLPKKALLTINNKSLIKIFIERISLSTKINKIVFATSDLPEDKPLAELASKEGLDVYCGHPEDVLLRLFETANKYSLKYFLTTMVDSPFQLKEVIDETVDKLVNSNFDMLYSYPNQPNGTDCYGLKTEALKKIIEIKEAVNTECWGKYFSGTGLFKWGEVNMFCNYPQLKEFRLTIDYPEDYEFCKILYTELTHQFGTNFSLDNMAQVLDSEKYKNMLVEIISTTKKWETHFAGCATDVDKDVERIKITYGKKERR